MNNHWSNKEESDELPPHWDKISQAFLQPLRAESSELFVQSVMRRVREYSQRDEWIRWPVFVRWAFPALAVSIASFTLSLAYVLQPSAISTEEVVLADREPLVPTDWVSGSSGSDDQASDSGTILQ
jgi:hypothetical protein